MTRSQKRKRSARIYWFCLILYGILITAAAVYALSQVWVYAEEYEGSRPNNTMDAYVAQLSENLWGEGIAETVSNMPHEVQTDDEVAEHVKALLSNGVSYVRKSGGGDNSINYSLRCNGNEFGVVKLVEDDSYADQLKFGMLPWKVESEEFDFNGLYSSVEIVVPKSYEVYLNDVKLGPEYIVEEGIKYDVLEDYYDEFQNLPSKVRYKYDDAIGTLEFSIKDENGEPFVIDESKDDSQFIKPCSEEEMNRLGTFSAGFVVNYLKYISGVTDPLYGYGQLKPFMVEGADLDQRMKNSMDGLSWAHTSSCTVNSVVLNSALALGDGFYLCDISSVATTFALGHGEVENNSNMRVIVVDMEGTIKAISLELY